MNGSSKSTVDEIRDRFDNDVDRFSDLETGQSATVDAALAMSLVARTAAAVTPQATRVLDVGCGAGNYSLKLLELLPNLDVTLIDLSQPMLDRARKRVSAVTTGDVTTQQIDVRNFQPLNGEFDMILAAAVLHHLRTPAEWEAVFAMFFRSLRPGGAVWIFDLVESSIPGVQQVTWQDYGEYLTAFRDATYRQHVFDYIAREDSPTSLMYQLNLLQQVGFTHVDVLHKHACFAAFGGVKV